uniref:Proteasomal ubiquitin receptor ADRM1 n=1 Tax=Cebus imitator TaxID=2715852 RepID=A0A2K5QRW2_CEBIM
MATSGALFPSLVPGSRGASSKYLVEFRAGKMSLKGTTVTPDKRKGLVYIQQTDDSLIHFCWKDRTSGNVEDDLIIFPDDCEFKRVPQCPSGRVYVLKFKAGSKRLLFWMQEPKTDQDEEHCRKVNEYLNNPPMPGALGASGSGGHELSALGGEGGLQSLLGNMSHSQLMQLIGPAGLGGLGNLALGMLRGPAVCPLSFCCSRSQSAAVTPSSTTSSTRATPAPSAPAAASATSPSPAPSSGNGASTAGSPTQPIQLSDLQSILATMNVPAGPAGGQQVDLASVLTPEIMAPILANSDVQERLLPYLPSGESLPQTADEIQNTLTSPQFQQALGMFSAALASGQLGPLMCQFGLPAEAVEAANKGDVEAFAKAMQNSAKPEQNEGDAKDKKDEEEDMSLD